MSNPSPLQLYVHIPFCVHKCHYCDFNSHERAEPDWSAYQQALITELKLWTEMPLFSGRKLSTIFFGGGTPSLAPPALIASVLNTADMYAGLDTDCEITLEANPGTVDADNFRAFKKAGVNRLSMGVQSLDENELRWLERIHGREEAIEAYQLARAAGFTNINLDLIYGLPDQCLDDWLVSLHTAIELAPEHLSCYQLTVEPHTKLAARHTKRPYALPDDETALAMFFETRSQLQDAAYETYEISNFAKPGLKCRHNDGYWLYYDYIGIGAGASGKWDMPEGGITRYSNLRSPEPYARAVLQNGQAINSKEILERKQAAAEALWLGLRRNHGVSRCGFQQRFGFDAWEHFAPDLECWRKCGKLTVTVRNIHLATEGLAIADTITASVL